MKLFSKIKQSLILAVDKYCLRKIRNDLLELKNLNNKKIYDLDLHFKRRMDDIDLRMQSNQSGINNVYNEFKEFNHLIKSDHIEIKYKKLQKINSLIEKNIKYCEEKGIAKLYDESSSLIDMIDDRCDTLEDLIKKLKEKIYI